ncbi:hypothetical protein HZC21_02930 [Candidatus Peregrinibacteria bacterium]|nr:hypothetical protein [Candidatus Peregrinibacteria bacterium]
MFVRKLRWLAIMIFVVGLFSFVVLTQAVKAAAASDSSVSLTKVCKETDRGNDKMTKGANTISYEDGTVYTTGDDYCYDKNTVAEFTCSNGQWDITYEDCGDGYACDLGACNPLVTSKPSCKDTDGGNEIFTRGTLSVYTPTYDNQTVIEDCADDKTMDELVCLTGDPTYAYTHKKTECPYGCKDGACVATAPIVDTNVDVGLYGFLTVGKNRKQVKWNETITLTPEDASSVGDNQATFSLVFAYKNYGNADSGAFSNKVAYDGLFNGRIGTQEVFKQDTRGLQAGENKEIITTVDLVFDKTTHSLKFYIDADNQIEESNKPKDYANEGNNTGMVLVKFTGFDKVVTQPEARYDTSAKPTIIAPFDGMTLTNYPRQAEIQWTPVTSVSKYELEVACDYCGSTRWGSVNTWTSTAVYMITPALAGDNQFRARVRAAYPDGAFSQWSDYVYFKYKTSAYTYGYAQTPTKPTVQPVIEPLPPRSAIESKPAVSVPKVIKKPVGRMLCGNSAGGDGLYSACVNNTIKHDSKINIKVRTYNNYYVWLTLTNAEKKYYKIPIRKSLEIDRDDGEMTIKITYVKKNAKYGVFLNIETTFDASAINPEEDVIEDIVETAPMQTSPMLPAYDEIKPSVTFGVSVNDYPDHKDYTKSKNLANAFVNVYTVSLADNGTFKVLSYTTESTGVVGVAKPVVKSGQMVYFEGYKTEFGAKVGAAKMMAQTWTAPPYKNFSSVKDELCQTNYSKTDEFLGGTQNYACATSLSMPYQD